MLFREGCRGWHEDGDRYKLRPVPAFHFIRAVYVATDTHERKDIFVDITHKHNVLCEIPQAQTLKVSIVNDTMYVVDSDLNLRRMGLTITHGHRPKVKWTSIHSLNFISELKVASQDQLKLMGLTDTTLSFKDKVYSLETGDVVFSGETFEKKLHEIEVRKQAAKEKKKLDAQQASGSCVKISNSGGGGGGNAGMGGGMEIKSKRGDAKLHLLPNQVLYGSSSKIAWISNPGSRLLRSIPRE